MKLHLLLAGLLLSSGVVFGGPCLPGSLQDYINLPVTGCDLNNVQFSTFELAPGQSFATPIDPNAVQLTPGGGQYTPTLLLTLNSSAAAGELFELFFRFNAAASVLTAGSISLGSPLVTGDAAVTGVLDVCAGGSFLGIEPLGCSGVPGTAIAFAVGGDPDAQLSSSVGFPVSSFFDVFVDLTVDGGLNGSALLESAAVSVTTPEPSTWMLMAAALGCLGIFKSRRGRRY